MACLVCWPSTFSLSSGLFQMPLAVVSLISTIKPSPQLYLGATIFWLLTAHSLISLTRVFLITQIPSTISHVLHKKSALSSRTLDMSHILFLPSQCIVTPQLAPSPQDECLLLIFVLSVLAQVIFVPSRGSLGATGNVGFPVYSCSSVGVLYYITLCVGKLSVFYFTAKKKNVFCFLTTMLLFASLLVTWFALLCTAPLYKFLTQTQACFFSLVLSLDNKTSETGKVDVS